MDFVLMMGLGLVVLVSLPLCLIIVLGK